MPTPLSKSVQSDFRVGQNSKVAPYLMKQGELTMARNVWWDARGQIEKRPGYAAACAAEVSPPANVVTGLNAYYPESGSPVLVYWRAGNGYLSSSCQATVSASVTGYSASLFMRMENAKNRLYGVNGSAGFVYDGTTWYTALGLTAPGSAPTVGVGAAGALTGDYKYKVTFTYGARGESNPSAASATLTLAAQKGSLTAIPTGGTGTTQRDLYRTKAGGATWYFLATIADNTTTTYTDNIGDGALGDEVDTDNDAPPAAKFIAWHLNMMFYAGNSAAPKRLYIGKIGNPEQVPALTNFIDVPVPGDEITGIASAANVGLLVFTNTAYYVLTGASVDTFRFRIVANGVGCTAPKSLVVYNDTAYFLYHEKLYRTSGGPAENVGDNVDNGWVPGLRANMREAVSTIWNNKLLIYVFLGTTAYTSKTGAADDTAANNRVWGLDLVLLEQAEETRESAWFEWTNHFPNVWFVAKGPSQNTETLYWGSNRATGVVYVQSAGGSAGTFSDAGTSITSRTETADLTEGDPNMTKAARHAWLMGKAASGQTVAAYYQLDQSGTWTAFPTASKSAAATAGGLFGMRFDFPGQATYQYLRLAFEETSTSYLLLHSIHMESRPLRKLKV